MIWRDAREPSSHASDETIDVSRDELDKRAHSAHYEDTIEKIGKDQAFGDVRHVL